MTTLRHRIALAALALCFSPAALSAQSSLAAVVSELELGEALGGFVGPLLDDTGFGSDLANIGDVDGNGVTDFAVGGGYHNGSRGALWIVFMDTDGSVLGEQRISEGLAGFSESLPSGATEFGAGLAAVGDVNGDGVPDLAVGSAIPEQVWILMLASDGTVADIVEIPFGALIPGIGIDLSLTALGDVDGNGTQDLALWMPWGNGFGVPATLLLLLDTDGSLLNSVALGAGSHPAIATGSLLGAVGDLDGNGVTEVAYVGAGKLSLAFLAADGAVLHTVVIADTPGFGGPVTPDAAAPLGDVDGDGIPDIAVSGGFLNTLWLLYLNADGTVRYSERIGAGEGGFEGSLATFDRFGSALSLLGDLDGDGTLELAVGANGTAVFPSMFPGIREGVVWILSLQNTWFDQGFALAGSGDAPLMVAEGSLEGGSAVSLSVDGGVPSAPMLLFLGASAIDAPFKQGMLVPAPDIARVFGFNAAGELNLVGHWPAGVPAGFRVFLQSWHVDAGAPGGFAGSNAVLGQTP